MLCSGASEAAAPPTCCSSSQRLMRNDAPARESPYTPISKNTKKRSTCLYCQLGVLDDCDAINMYFLPADAIIISITSTTVAAFLLSCSPCRFFSD